MVLKSAISILCLMICATHVARADPIHDAAKAAAASDDEIFAPYERGRDRSQAQLHAFHAA